MPPKQSTSAPRGRPPSKTSAQAAAGGGGGGGGGGSKSKAAGKKRAQQREQEQSPDEAMEDAEEELEEEVEDDDDEGQPKTIPPELLTRILHEFFESEGTRVTRDANGAVARYMDIFVREAIARAAVERESGFLEVEDLEKVAPQLLLDL